MYALTVRQPWAWEMIHGDKRIENRTWPTRYRGPLLIHAAVAPYRPTDPKYFGLVFGAAIGLVDVIDCVPLADVADQPFACGPWCWVTADPRPLTQPVPCKGALGLWRLSVDLLPLIVPQPPKLVTR